MSPTSWRHWLRGLFAVNELKHKQKAQIAFQRGHRKQKVQKTEKHNHEKGSNCIIEHAWGNTLFTVRQWNLTSELSNGKQKGIYAHEFRIQPRC